MEEKPVGEVGDPRASRIGAQAEEGLVEADGFGRGAEPPPSCSGQEFFDLPGVALAEVGFPGVQAVQQTHQHDSITASTIPAWRFSRWAMVAGGTMLLNDRMVPC